MIGVQRYLDTGDFVPLNVVPLGPLGLAWSCPVTS